MAVFASKKKKKKVFQTCPRHPACWLGWQEPVRPVPVRAGDAPNLLPHPGHIPEGRIIEREEEQLCAVGQVFHQAPQRGLGGPQALQKTRPVGVGVDDERSPKSPGRIRELSIQGSDSEGVCEVPWFWTVRQKLFFGSRHERIAFGVR